MRWIKVNVFFQADNIPLAEELISDIFFTEGLKGVICEVPLCEPVEGFASNALSGPKENSISGFLPHTPSSVDTLENIKKRASLLKDSMIKVWIKTALIDEQDWSESWKQFFFVSRITDKIVIKPSWRDYKAAPEDIIIEIDPGMAFGTGTHETTSMCIKMIEKYLISGKSFMDIGTGSGILMIAAAKLGAGTLDGIDTDEIAVKIAIKNMGRNGLSPGKYHIEKSTIEEYKKNQGKIKKFDLIAANIIAEIIIEILPEIKKRLNPQGTAILSGIINTKKELVISEIIRNGLSIIEVMCDKEWVSIVITCN